MTHKNSQLYKIIISIFVLAVTVFFLFYNLGHYALWDDEADTALFALSVWQTGDTHAMLDHNLIAHTEGQELKNLYNRYIPPLGFYLAAPFVGLAPGSALAARLPFALCGLLTVGLMLFWLWRQRASMSTWLLMSAGILGNVSLMLYGRQCRYYAPAILATTALVFLYFNRDGRKRALVSIVLVSLFLLASNHMFYVAVYVCLIVDYLFWGRKTKPFRYSQLAIIFFPQLIFGGVLASIYNLTGGKINWDFTDWSWLIGKLQIIFWNLREINSCEHGVGLLILIAPLLYLFTKNKFLLRSSLAILMYVISIAFIAPEPFEGYSMATVRYLAPVIPLCIFTAVLSIQALTVHVKWLAIALAVLAFGTNVLHGGPMVGIDKKTMFSRIIAEGRYRSTVIDFVGELLNPPPSTYRAAADWVNKNLNDKETVWVMPSFATYPLMFHAPKALYAWQLKEKTGQFANLPDIHFVEKTPPQYVIAFGPQVGLVYQSFKRMKAQDIHYTKIEQIDLYWYDLIRPELFWHSFRQVKNFSSDSQAVYIFKQVDHP